MKALHKTLHCPRYLMANAELCLLQAVNITLKRNRPKAILSGSKAPMAA